MTLCPIALIASCKQCPMYKVCPAKGILGDEKKDPDKTQEKDQK